MFKQPDRKRYVMGNSWETATDQQVLDLVNMMLNGNYEKVEQIPLANLQRAKLILEIAILGGEISFIRE